MNEHSQQRPSALYEDLKAGGLCDCILASLYILRPVSLSVSVSDDHFARCTRRTVRMFRADDRSCGGRVIIYTRAPG
jgi:hypothetical protein